MTIVGVSITKKVAFRDSTQEFSNTYHYDCGVITNEAALGENLIDRLVALEKPLHGNTVTFTMGRAWTSGGTKQENHMIFVKPLTGTGTSTLTTSMDKERAYLIKWQAGVDNRGHPVTLKKWFHLQAQISGATNSSSIINQDTGYTSTERASIAAAMNGFNPIVTTGGLGTFPLVAESGRSSTQGAIAHKYLEHHQLGEQWR